MKKINQEQIIKRAKQTGISPYLQIKRELKYRKAEERQIKKLITCLKCINRVDPPWKDFAGKNSCLVLGLNKDRYAFVENDRICDVWSRK